MPGKDIYLTLQRLARERGDAATLITLERRRSNRDYLADRQEARRRSKRSRILGLQPQQ